MCLLQVEMFEPVQCTCLTVLTISLYYTHAFVYLNYCTYFVK